MPPAAVVKNVYEMRLDEKKAEGIEALPATLSEAVDELEKDEYILEVLGEHISRNYIAAKRTEWAEYTSQVTDWEIEQYLYKIQQENEDDIHSRIGTDDKMNVVIAFPKIENAKSIRSILMKSGYQVDAVCTTGGQALQNVNALDGGILICGYRFADMMCR